MKGDARVLVVDVPCSESALTTMAALVKAEAAYGVLLQDRAYPLVTCVRRTPVTVY